MSMGQTTANAELIQLPIDLLEPNPLQPRGSISAESLIELTDSIRTHGVLEPLLVAKTSAGYQIIAGERRWRAAKAAGLTQVPAHVIEVDPNDMLMLAIIENVQRDDLNPFEEAAGYYRLHKEFDMTHEQIAQRVGKSRETVTNSMRLLKLPDLVKNALLNGEMSKSQAEILLQFGTSEMMVQVYQTKIMQEKYNVRQLEELARRLRAEGKTPESRGGAPRKWHKDNHSKVIEENLAKLLSSEVQLSRSRRKIRLILDFKEEERFQEVIRAIEQGSYSE